MAKRNHEGRAREMRREREREDEKFDRHDRENHDTPEDDYVDGVFDSEVRENADMKDDDYFGADDAEFADGDINDVDEPLNRGDFIAYWDRGQEKRGRVVDMLHSGHVDRKMHGMKVRMKATREHPVVMHKAFNYDYQGGAWIDNGDFHARPLPSVRKIPGDFEIVEGRQHGERLHDEKNDFNFTDETENWDGYYKDPRKPNEKPPRANTRKRKADKPNYENEEDSIVERMRRLLDDFDRVNEMEEDEKSDWDDLEGRPMDERNPDIDPPFDNSTRYDDEEEWDVMDDMDNPHLMRDRAKRIRGRRR